MNERKPRKNYSPEEKAAIIKKHFIDGIPISTLCEQNDLQPSQFYTWQKTFFENAANTFVSNGDKKSATEKKSEKEIEYLKSKIQRKDEVLAELMEEHIKLKKNFGEI